MVDRRGEKIGWLGGWLGGFLWTVPLGVLWLARGTTTHGVAFLVVFVLAVGAIPALAPWRHPRRPYWQLMVPLYALLAGAAAVTVSLAASLLPDLPRPLAWLGFAWLLPCLIPLWTTGRRTWHAGTVRPTGG